MSLGNNIKKYRRDMGLTQEELAGILCITSQAVSKWESGAGLPDIAQIVPLAQALNVTTDALFGFTNRSYDEKLAAEVGARANVLRDSGEQSQGALSAVEYLDSQCEEDIFNYGIMTKYVQAVAHLSRYVNPQNSYYSELFKDDIGQWNKIVRTAENRAMQVIRYSDSKKLADECHYALAKLFLPSAATCFRKLCCRIISIFPQKRAKRTGRHRTGTITRTSSVRSTNRSSIPRNQ